MTNKTLIIAEAGVNHNGDINLAKKLVDAAAEAGADIVKFQTFRSKSLVTRFAPKAQYQNTTTDPGQSQFSMLEKLELTSEMHEQLIGHCAKSGIDFLSTAFDIPSLDYLASLGAAKFKIPSGEITNLPYLDHVARFKKPVLLSTGMALLGEIEAAVQVLEAGGLDRSNITILHCNTEYPTPMEDVNLRAMVSIREAFDVSVGYSDHTLGIEVPIAAVTLGAIVIEKHLTMNPLLEGPDHRASLDPISFKAMVQAIRNIEKALGSKIKHPSLSESKNRPIVRKSIVAGQVIEKGEAFTVSNLAVKRPGTGISPMRWNEVIGSLASRRFEPDEEIEL